jgi:hypothetical protein
LRLGVNLKNFPSSSVPAMFAALFHLGIAAVLLLYVLFWLKVSFPLRSFRSPLFDKFVIPARFPGLVFTHV